MLFLCKGTIEFFLVNIAQHIQANIFIRTGLVILLVCDSGVETAVKLDLFEDVLSADWIYPDCRREGNMKRLSTIRLHVRVRLLSARKPTSMQGGEYEYFDALSGCDGHNLCLLFIYEKINYSFK